jgi:phytoene dehydrogenase-like protein
MESLAKVIRRKGSEIWTRSWVKRILVSAGVVAGVVVGKEGDEIEVSAKAVISNAGPTETVGLVGEQNLDKGYVKELKEKIHHGSQMLISFASHRPLIGYVGGLALVGARRVVNISCLTLSCPELSPPGWCLHTAQCQPISQFTPLDRGKEIEAAMDDLRENVPGFDEHAEILNISCMFNPEWPGYHNLPGYWLPQRTPIENLYNVGDGVCSFPEGPYSAVTSRPVVEELKTRIKPGEA